MKDPRRSIDVLREKIEAGERGGSNADRDVLMEFSDQLELLSSKYSDFRHLKLLRHCTRIAEEVGGLADSLDDRDAAEEIVRWIHRTYDNEETNRDYRSAIRVFGKRTTRSDEPPESIVWVPTGTSSTYDPMPSESDMLDWEDDVKNGLLPACRNSRDAAAIALEFEAGLRSGEFESLTVGDLVDGEHALGVEIHNQKTGSRTVHLLVAVPYVQRWIADHPAGDDPDAPLWTKLSTPDSLSYNGMLAMFREPAKRTSVTKPVTPTNFRKSNTRWLVRRKMSQSRIEDRQGRKRGSEHTARYMARFGDESNEVAYAALHGEDVEEADPEAEAPITCPRCNDPTPRDGEYCIHCNFSLDLEVTQLLEEITDGIDQRLVAADGIETRSDLVSGKQLIESNPKQFDKGELHELASKFSSD